MHDLNTINRLNAEAFSKAIDHFRAQGRWVLATYDGLHLLSIETFSTAESAAAALTRAHQTAGPSNHFKVLGPVPAWTAAQRDQSEDRPTADPLTLAGYINRVQTQGN